MDVAKEFNISKDRLVGGGYFQLQGKKQLSLYGGSDSCKSIPKEVAQIFAELMIPELEKLGIEVKEIHAYPREDNCGIDLVNPYWRNQGFRSK